MPQNLSAPQIRVAEIVPINDSDNVTGPLLWIMIPGSDGNLNECSLSESFRDLAIHCGTGSETRDLYLLLLQYFYRQ